MHSANTNHFSSLSTSEPVVTHVSIKSANSPSNDEHATNCNNFWPFSMTLTKYTYQVLLTLSHIRIVCRNTMAVNAGNRYK